MSWCLCTLSPDEKPDYYSENLRFTEHYKIGKLQEHNLKYDNSLSALTVERLRNSFISPIF
jgi:hypothetical protein